MKKIYSLKSKADFDRVIDKGIKIRNQHLFIAFEKNSSYDSVKIGISIPKKIANAINRNKNKRQIKNILDSIPQVWTWKMNIVIVAKQDYIKLSFAEKKTILTNSILKIK